jgi:TolB protein
MPSPRERIVFDGGFPGPVFTVSAGGGDLQAIVTDDNGTRCFHPDWSPDGTRIALACSIEGNGDIYTVDPDGAHLSRVTDGPHFETDPIWAPDGSRIAFIRSLSAEPYGWELVTVSPDGSDQVVVAREPSPDEFAAVDTSYTWSPDGTQIAFNADSLAGKQVFVVNADGTGLRQLTRERRPLLPYVDEALWPSWSTDGTHIVFVRAYGISMIGANGLGERVIASGYLYFTPQWAPDGRSIAFTQLGEQGEYPLYVYDVETATTSRLNQGVRTLTFEWAPDGCHIAFVAGHPDQWSLYIASIETLDTHEILPFGPSSQIPLLGGMSWEP